MTAIGANDDSFAFGDLIYNAIRPYTASRKIRRTHHHRPGQVKPAKDSPPCPQP
jgi:hypothetical protein